MKRLSFQVIFLVLAVAQIAQAQEVAGVPFKSQSPPSNWDSNMNCGPTAALMVATYYRGETATTDGLKALLDWLYEEHIIFQQPMAEYYDGNVTNVLQVKRMLADYFHLGQVSVKRGRDFEYLRQELDRGNPVILGVNVLMNPGKIGHFMVLVGMDESTVTVHDPGRTFGADNVYSISTFENSWRTSGFSSVVVQRAGARWHPDGTLVQVVGQPEVYQVINEQLYWITNEASFNAHNFDWNKIISISQEEFDCFLVAGEIDWQPQRELFRVGSAHYLAERETALSNECTVYEFASEMSFNSWNVSGSVADLRPAEAEEIYFSECRAGGLLYLRNGTLLKPNYIMPDRGAGVVFVAVDNGELRAFSSWRAFYYFGYDYLPVLLVNEEELANSTRLFGENLIFSDSQFCAVEALSVAGGAVEVVDNDTDGFSALDGDCNDEDATVFPGQSEECDNVDNNCDGQVDEEVRVACVHSCGLGWQYCYAGIWLGCDIYDPVEEVDDGVDNDCDGLIDEGFDIPEDTDPRDVDNDGDGVTPNEGDCDDWEPTVHSGHPEVCDVLDNDCDLLIDEGEVCPSGFICSSGRCQEVEPDGVDLPSEFDGDLPEENIICTIQCPEEMMAFAWYGAAGSVSGQPALVNITKGELCERGRAWLDFNCACEQPSLWACYDWSAAEVGCNQEIEVGIGVVDARGEGEIWFTEIECD